MKTSSEATERLRQVVETHMSDDNVIIRIGDRQFAIVDIEDSAVFMVTVIRGRITPATNDTGDNQ